MEQSPTIKVTPIYGWGWVIAGQPRFEPPAPFSLAVDMSEHGSWSGRVLNAGHEFVGRRVVLSQRHTSWDGAVNIIAKAESDAAQASSGFGIIEGASPEAEH